MYLFIFSGGKVAAMLEFKLRLKVLVVVSILVLGLYPLESLINIAVALCGSRLS